MKPQCLENVDVCSSLDEVKVSQWSLTKMFATPWTWVSWGQSSVARSFCEPDRLGTNVSVRHIVAWPAISLRERMRDGYFIFLSDVVNTVVANSGHHSLSKYEIFVKDFVGILCSIYVLFMICVMKHDKLCRHQAVIQRNYVLYNMYMIICIFLIYWWFNQACRAIKIKLKQILPPL